MIERAALALLVAMTLIFGYNLLGASERFGNATEAYDGLTAEFVSFEYQRGDEDAAFTVALVNPTDHIVVVEAFDYSFVANGVGVGGGEYRAETEVAPRSNRTFDLSGRVFDLNFISRQPTDEPIDWYVPMTVLVSIDEDLDSTWMVFGFRARTS